MKILFYLQHFDPLIQTDLLKLNLIVFADDTMMNKYKSSFKTNSLGLFLVLLIIYYTNMGMLTNDITTECIFDESTWIQQIELFIEKHNEVLKSIL